MSSYVKLRSRRMRRSVYRDGEGHVHIGLVGGGWGRYYHDTRRRRRRRDPASKIRTLDNVMLSGDNRYIGSRDHIDSTDT